MKTIETNVGRIDQVLRIAGGLLLILLFALGVIGPWGLLGLVALATGLVRFCPVYRLLGLHTCGSNVQRLP
ncbi:YgaP family membrane protein [Ramlibacter sp. Leaf400]|uniref:YgaP family membrane protein n=1 Tax=Ramlibacter sp. Leaf400 TaxID=1736365 RepID=UPI00268FECF4